ncbi:autotransporter outer membrane beta-barrel domain-containing protein [uncultured Phascolarctobacterium sp.]|uniref:autotransporter outer membrane beta-barrel domain-containing protein n=1 Tax=uncultured Phascolarctobacterium sp. TaxID=512296 RepID=UPI0025E8CB5D|nr:autotransporter outer membrane beta-barrel domain-containing protein [uncultured Phascolarctobacterium sp.]
MKNKKMLALAIMATLTAWGNHSTYALAATTSQINIDGSTETQQNIDLEYSATGSPAVNVNNNGDLTLDGSNKITSKNDNWESNSHGIVVQNGSRVAVKEGTDTTITVKGNGSHGIYVTSNGTMMNNGELNIVMDYTGWGAAYAIAAQDGNVVLGEDSKTAITITSGGTTGVYAAAGSQVTSNGYLKITAEGSNAWSSAISADAGKIALGSKSKTDINVTGDGGKGLSAVNGGAINGSGLLNIESSGQYGNGIEASGNGEIYFMDGSEVNVITTGADAFGISAANSGIVSSVGKLDITTKGQSSHGVMAGADGEVKLAYGSDVKITTDGSGSHGVYTNGTDSKTTIGGTLVITTTGAQDSHGIAAADGGQVTLTDSSDTQIETSGSRSHGFYAAGGTINGSGKVDITTAAAETSGLFAQNGGKIVQSGDLTVTTAGAAAHGVYAGGATAQVNLSGKADVVTKGDAAHALYVQEGGTLELAGQIKAGTYGAQSSGIYASGNGTISTTEPSMISVTTEADKAHGVNADGGTITLAGTAVVDTKGDSASGLRVSNGGKISTATPSLILVTTKADKAHGINANGGTITLTGTAEVKTSGDGANGISADGAGSSIQLENVLITTEGAEAHGLAVNDGGKISFDGAARITMTETRNAYALHAYTSGSSITGQGQIDITGNIYAGDGGKIEVAAADNSRLIGDIIAASAGSTDFSFGTGSLFTGSTMVDGVGAENRLTLGSSSLWQLTGTSSLTALTNDAVIDMRQDNNSFSTLTVDNLNGNGTIIMDIDGAAVDQSDKLIVNDTFTGNQVLSLQEINGRDSDIGLGQSAVGTVLATVNNGNGVFTADDHEGSLYWERYELGSQANGSTGYTDWYLKAVDTLNPGNNPTTTVKTAMAAGALAYHTWRVDDKLMERMGDLRQQGGEAQGVWVRLKGGKLSHDGKYGFENKYTMYELGYDQVMKKTADYTRYGGVSMSYSDGSSSYDSGSGDNKNKALSFYVTQLGEKGHYVDVVAKFNHMDSDFTVFDSNGKRITGDFENTGVSLSAEYGRKNSLSQNGWYVEPQAQMTVGYLGGSNYLSNQVQVDQSGISSVVGRLGFNLGRDIDKKTNFYLKANLLHEFSGGYDVTFTDKFGNRAKLDDDFNDTWFEYGAGVAFQGSKNSYFYLDVERSAGSDYKKDWQWNVGASWTF